MRIWWAMLLVGCGPSVFGALDDGGVVADGVVAGDGVLIAGDGATADLVVAEPPLRSATFTAIPDDILNPERGFYDQINILGTSTFSSVRGAGRVLAYAPVVLDPNLDTIPSSLLIAARAGLERVKTAGIKVILRFTYNDCACGDAPRARILGHLQQLTTLLHDEADVIAVLQAGLIGQWGEWHNSSNGLDNAADRKAILDALLLALPPERMVQIRTPMFKSEALGGALVASEAYSGTARARVGHHNDCFLASDSDQGTYASPVATWKTYVATDGAFTPVGGETCALNAPRSECASATAEMAQLHWSFVNALYHQGVLGAWQTDGCLPTIRRSVGPRFRLASASWSEKVRPGGLLRVVFTIDNDGWATPFNARPVLAVLDDGKGLRRTAPLAATIDPRLWPTRGAPITVTLRIPADAAPGTTYRLGLWLPDASSRLQGDPRYAIRFGGSNVWNATTGDNQITDQLVVDATPGSVDPNATTFAQVP